MIRQDNLSLQKIQMTYLTKSHQKIYQKQKNYKKKGRLTHGKT